MHRILPFFLLFGSGLAALAYQVVWMREFRLVFGASTASTAAVSALFMAGLGIGSWIFGPRADRVQRPLFMYGMLELGIALFAAISPFLMQLCRGIYLSSGGAVTLGDWGATAARLGLSAIVLGVPTILMGGTLPAAVRAVTTESDGARRSLGLLYGINTLGALTGTLATNFLLMEMFGARVTLYIAVALNLIVAFAAIGVSKKGHLLSAEASENGEKTDGGLGTSSLSVETSAASANEIKLPSNLILATAAGVGFVFFLMELVWYRMLAPVLGGSTYTFGLILAVALAGIGLGGACYPLFFKNRRISLGILAATCLVEALMMIIPYAIGDDIPLLALQISPLSAFGFGGQVVVWTVITLIVVFPAAFISGVQFPLLIALLGQGTKNIGVQTGHAYALNTAGAIMGSLAGGFGLMPWLSAPMCWLLAAALLTLMGLLIGLHVHFSSGGETSRSVGFGSLACLLVLALLALCFFAVGPTAGWRNNPIGAGRKQIGQTNNELKSLLSRIRYDTIWEADGVESSVAITGMDGFAFIINGKSDGSVIYDRGTQIMVGMIGAALHPNPRRSLVVGLGTGCTAGWLSAIESMEMVDAVELEPVVLEMCRRSAAANHDVVGKAERGEGVRIWINDAREVLSTIPEKYDVIVSEPSNPYRAGIASLFTVEFYEGVRGRLASNGIFVSWCQAYEIDAETVTTIMATLKQVFPSVECWFTQTEDLVFIASMEPIRPDIEKLRQRLAEPAYRDAMRIGWRKEGLEGFVSQFAARRSFIDEVVAAHRGGINTDDLMRVEYAYARTLGKVTAFSQAALYQASRIRRTSMPDWIDPAKMDIELIVDNYFLTLPLSEKPTVSSDLLPDDLQRRLRAINSWEGNDYVRAVLLSQDTKKRHQFEYLVLAESLANTGNGEALKHVPVFADWWPASAEFIKARLAYEKGNHDEAAAFLSAGYALLRTAPWEVKKTVYEGIMLAERIVAAKPDLAEKLYAALEEPFQMNYLEHQRRTALMSISTVIGPKKVEEVFMRWNEPNILWDGPLLAARVQCYLETQNPLLGKAVQDLEEFNANVAPDIEKLLESE